MKRCCVQIYEGLSVIYWSWNNCNLWNSNKRYQ